MVKNFEIKDICFMKSANFVTVSIQTKETYHNIFIDTTTGEISNYDLVKNYISRNEIYQAVILYANKVSNEVKLAIMEKFDMTGFQKIKNIRKALGKKKFEKLMKQLGYKKVKKENKNGK